MGGGCGWASQNNQWQRSASTPGGQSQGKRWDPALLRMLTPGCKTAGPVISFATVVASSVPLQLLPSLPSASPSLSFYFSYLGSQRAGSQATAALPPVFSPRSLSPTTMAGISGQQWEVWALSSSSATEHMWPIQWRSLPPPANGASLVISPGPQERREHQLPMGQSHKTYRPNLVLNPMRMRRGHWHNLSKQFTK